MRMLAVTHREAQVLNRHAPKILEFMRAGLYYPWDLGYNTELRTSDLEAAMRETSE